MGCGGHGAAWGWRGWGAVLKPVSSNNEKIS